MNVLGLKYDKTFYDCIGDSQIADRQFINANIAGS